MVPKSSWRVAYVLRLRDARASRSGLAPVLVYVGFVMHQAYQPTWSGIRVSLQSLFASKVASQSIADSKVVSSAMPSSFTLRFVWLSWMTRVGVAVMPFDRAMSMSDLMDESTSSLSFAHFSSRDWSSSGKSNVPPGSPPPLPAD